MAVRGVGSKKTAKQNPKKPSEGVDDIEPGACSYKESSLSSPRACVNTTGPGVDRVAAENTPDCKGRREFPPTVRQQLAEPY